MNYKGHTPTLLIILVAFVLIIAALTTYIQANKPIEIFSKDIAYGLRAQGQYESYVKQAFEDSVSEVFKENPETLDADDIWAGIFNQAGLRDYGLPRAGNFFIAIKRGDFDVKFNGESWVIDVPNLYVPYSFGRVEITHYFNATAIVSKDGRAQYIYK